MLCLIIVTLVCACQTWIYRRRCSSAVAAAVYWRQFLWVCYAVDAYYSWAYNTSSWCVLYSDDDIDCIRVIVDLWQVSLRSPRTCTARSHLPWRTVWRLSVVLLEITPAAWDWTDLVPMAQPTSRVCLVLCSRLPVLSNRASDHRTWTSSDLDNGSLLRRRTHASRLNAALTVLIIALSVTHSTSSQGRTRRQRIGQLPDTSLWPLDILRLKSARTTWRPAASRQLTWLTAVSWLMMSRPVSRQRRSNKCERRALSTADGPPT